MLIDLISSADLPGDIRHIRELGEDAAYETFRKLRWTETQGEPVCPKCGCLDHYDIPTRRKFKCAACHAQYSVTSGTMFASRKLSFTDLLAAICLFVNGSKGMSASDLGRELGVQYRTAWDISSRLRKELSATNSSPRPCTAENGRPL